MTDDTFTGEIDEGQEAPALALDGLPAAIPQAVKAYRDFNRASAELAELGIEVTLSAAPDDDTLMREGIESYRLHSLQFREVIDLAEAGLKLDGDDGDG